MEKKKQEKNCCHKKKQRDTEELKNLINRLSRIEGQVRGVKGMVENDAYCIDILNQVSAISAALNSFSKVLLENHIKACVVTDIKQGKDEVVDELVSTIKKFM
ncbi:MAG: metal-sensing transcriptional repressor [Lachnospira sp.]